MEREHQTVYLSLGSNLGDRVKNLKEALTVLDGEHLTTKRVSSFFETEPVGYREQPWFLNLAVAAETLLSPQELLRRCLEVERGLGRVRDIQGGPRTVDIDILLYDNVVARSSALTIPHERLAERRFVLVPLRELEPTARHPITERTVLEMLGDTRDSSRVVKLKGNDEC